MEKSHWELVQSRHSRHTSLQDGFLFSLVSIFSLASSAWAQQQGLGVGVVFRFVLDFNLTCAGLAQLEGKGGGWAQAVSLPLPQGTPAEQQGLDLQVSREGPNTAGFGSGGPMTC